MSSKVKPIPDGYHTVTPYMMHKDSARAIDFYKKAFGAEEIMRMPGPDGKLMHAEIKIGDSVMMLSDQAEQCPSKAPDPEQGTSTSFFLYVEDIDASFKVAVDAGCKSTMEPTDMFWGDRFGTVRDPFGYDWSLATHKEDLTPEEIQKRQAEFMKQMAHTG